MNIHTYIVIVKNFEYKHRKHCSITVPVVDLLGGVPPPNEVEEVNKKIQA